MALDVGQLYALFTLDTSDAMASFDSVGSRLTGIGEQVIRIGTLWQQAFTRPIVNGMRDVVETGMDFDEAMASVRAKAGIDVDTEEGQAAYTALRDTVLSVAQASVYTASEMAGAYDKMAMAGWNWQSMVGGLQPIADLAAASGEGLVGVSDIVTDAMTAFGLTWESALNQAGGDVDQGIAIFQGMVQHFTDVLATAATRSNTDVGMMGESFKYAATMAGALSYNVDDVALALGLMANRGIKASQAGTMARRVLGNLVSPTNEGMTAAINELGISLYNSETGMLDFMGVMLQLREKMMGADNSPDMLAGIRTLLDEQMDSAAYKAYMSEWERFYDQGSAAYQDYINTLQAGEQPLRSLDDFIEGMMDPATLQAMNASMEQLQAAMESLAASDAEMPDALKIVKWASEIGGIRGMPALLAIVTASEEEFGALATAISNSEGAANQMKTTALDSAKGDLEMLISNIDILKQSIYQLVSEDLRGLLQSATEVIQKFIDMDDETKTTILQMAGMAAAIGPALVGIGTMLKLLPALGSAFSFLASPIGIVVAALGAFALHTMDSEGKLSAAMERMKSSLGTVGDALGLEMPDLGLEDLDLEALISGFLDSFTDFANSESVQNFMSRLGAGFQAAIGKIGEIDYSAILDTMLGTVTDFAGSPAVQSFMTLLGNGLRSGGYLIGDITGELVKYIASPEGIAKILNAGSALGKALVTGVWEGIWSLGEGLATGLLTGLGLQEGVDFLSPSKKKTQEEYEGWQQLMLKDATDSNALGLAAGIQIFTGAIDKSGFDEAASGVSWEIANAFSTSLATAMEDAANSDAPVRAFRRSIETMMNTLAGEGKQFDFSYYFPEFYDSLTRTFDSEAFYAAFYEQLSKGGNISEAFQPDWFSIRIDPTQQVRPMEEAIAVAQRMIEEKAGEQGMSDSWITKNKEYVRQQIEAYYEELAAGVAEGAEQAKETASEASNAVQEIYDTMIAPMLDNSGDAAEQAEATVSAIEGTYAGSTGRVSAAAHTLEDAAVQEFLVNMSAENGVLIAQTFIAGIESALLDPDGTLVAAATTVANGVIITFQTILSADAGTNIGSAFGSAVASAVSSAASQIAQQVADMTASLNSAQQMVNSASSQLTLPPYMMTNASARVSPQGASAPSAAQISAAVRSGLSGVTVSMDGVTVGNLVTPVVSENIAADAAIRG